MTETQCQYVKIKDTRSAVSCNVVCGQAIEEGEGQRNEGLLQL